MEKGFCKEMGLNVEIKKFTSGGVAAQSFLAGQGDFLDSGDWPAVRSWLTTDDKEDRSSAWRRTPTTETSRS